MENVTKTYALQENGEAGAWEVRGRVDELAALSQAISLMLQVEQGEYEIFSDEYGLKVSDLVGRDRPYVAAELERRIKECLLVDERILAVEDFAVSGAGGRMLVNFVVKSVYGEMSESAEVMV